MVEVTMKFPFLLHSVLKGLTFFWPLLLILTPFGFMAAFFWRKLRYKWLLLVPPVLYLLGEVWVWLSVTGVLGSWGIDVRSPMDLIRYLLFFTVGELLGFLFSLWKKPTE